LSKCRRFKSNIMFIWKWKRTKFTSKIIISWS